VSLASIDFTVNCQDTSKKGRLVAFDAAGVDQSGQLLLRHETVTVNLRPVKPALAGSNSNWVDVDTEAARAANGVRLGLGEFDKPPTAGDWPLSFNGDDTGLTALGFAISADDLKTALAANPAIVTAGGISSVIQSGRSYRITFATFGAKADFSTDDENNLLPLSSVSISRVIVGDVDTHEVVVVTVKRRPYAFCDSWTSAPAAAVVVTTVLNGSGTNDDVQLITLTPGCYDGRYSVTLVLPNWVTGDGGGTTSRTFVLHATDTEDDVLTALLAHPEAIKTDKNGIEVTGNVGGPFTVEFIAHQGNQDIAQMTYSNIDLAAPRTLTGDLDLNQDALSAFFDSITGNQADLTVELEIQYPGGSPAKVYQDTWTVGRDLFNFETMRPRTNASFPTNGEIVRYERGITDFAGLSALVTASGGVQCVIVAIAGSPRMWELVAGTDATDTASGIQRPDDFDASTNAYVWKSIF